MSKTGVPDNVCHCCANGCNFIGLPLCGDPDQGALNAPVVGRPIDIGAGIAPGASGL